MQPCCDSWFDEYRLIGRIWKGQFPAKNAVRTPLSLIERSVMTLLVVIRSLSLVHVKGLVTALCQDRERTYRIRSALSELYVVGWLAALVFILACAARTSGFWAVVVVYRLVDGFNYRLCIVFVDRYAPGWGLRSRNRSLVLLLFNYIEMILGFAYLFLVTQSVRHVPLGTSEPVDLQGAVDALYFSTVTITTLGYGDFQPYTATGRILVTLEATGGVVFLALVLATFLTMTRDDERRPPNG